MESFGVSILLASHTDASRLKALLEHDRAQVHTLPDVPCLNIALEPKGGLSEWALAESLASFILQYKEKDLLNRMVHRHFADFETHEKAEIVRLCQSMLANDAADNPVRPPAGRRKEKIISTFAELLREFHFFHLEGILHFRMQPYLEELKEWMDYAVDEFLMEKQYQDFISLLRYFVFVQETRMPAAHLVHHGDIDFKLYDEKLRPIETKQTDGVLLETLDQDLNYEDLIVSTLLTVSPQRVYIHTRDADSQIIRTIRQIFESRAELCHYCPMCCRMLEGSSMHESPLSPT